MAGDPYWKFYPGDWRKDPGVQSLDYFDRGVWFELLLFMHESEIRGVLLLGGESPSDVELARLLGLPTKQTRDLLERLVQNKVADRCPETKALVCRRMRNESDLSSKRAAAGQLGGKAKSDRSKRSKTPSKTLANTDSDSDSESNNSGEGVQGEGRAPPLREQVNAIYAAYPRKQGKRAAMKAIERALKRGVSFVHLLKRTQQYAASKEDVKGTEDMQFVPYPATWFNQGRYEDEIESVTRSTKQPTGRIAAPEGKYDNLPVRRT